MAVPSQNSKLNHLSPLNTSWHNRSMSSMSATSDTATFHSAHAHLSNLELRPLSQQTHIQIQPSDISFPSHTPTQTQTSIPTPLISPKLEAIKMSRQDSGYSESSTPRSPTSSRRTSIASGSSSRPSNSKPKRKTTGTSSHSSRPSTKRNSRSEARIRTSTSGSRPGISQRHTIPYTTHDGQDQDIGQGQQYQFFHFPTFPSCPSSSSNAPEITPVPISQPPATVQYWTSDSTRRLEYAAIDAASKGVKGFFIKMLPDCILPAGSRRTKFHCEDGGSDCGSVRRYRLVLPEEKGDSDASARECGEREGGKGLFKRWSFGRERK